MESFSNSVRQDVGADAGARVPIDLLVTHGTVLTMDPQHLVLDDGAVAIQEGRIVEIGLSHDLQSRYQANSEIDAKGMAIMPGLVDTYGHAGHGLNKGIHHPELGWPTNELYFHASTPSWWRAEGRLAALERVRFGVTCGLSVIGGTPARMDSTTYAEEQAKAYAELGLRGVLAVGPPDPHLSHLPEPWTATEWKAHRPKVTSFTYEQALDNSISFIEKWHGTANGRIRGAISYPYLFGRQAEHPRIPFTYEKHHVPTMIDKATEIRKLAREHEVLLHSHVFVGAIEFALEHYGWELTQDLLGSDLLLAHANGLRQPEIDLLGKTGTGISVVAFTHENLYYGPCPVIELLDAGAVVTITTDGTAPYCSYDLIREVPRAIWAQWQRFGDQHVLPPGKALRMITIDAARALGLSDEIGSLEAGKRADLIVLDLTRPHLIPNAFIPRQLAFYANGNDVDTVIVDGQLLMRHREVLCSNEETIIKEARKEAAAALSRYDISQYVQTDRSFWERSRY